jgi:hypothetical protein
VPPLRTCSQIYPIIYPVSTLVQDKRIDFEISLILKNSLKKQQGEHKSTVIFKKNRLNSVFLCVYDDQKPTKL